MAKTTQSNAATTDQQESFFDGKRLSDVTIKFGFESIAAHKVTLAQGSAYFRKMFCGNFKEADSTEIQLFDDDPLAVNAMIRFLYGLDYKSAGTTSDWLRLRPHALVYAVAEKYDLASLKNKVGDVVASNFKTGGLDLYDIDDFSSALRIIWLSTTSNDNILRPLLADRCSKKIHQLVKDAALVGVMRGTELGADMCVRTERDLAKLRSKESPCVGKDPWAYPFPSGLNR